ncbi:DUF262 domain-containing protein [Spiroplasma endosymbiont of Aspidapion aeneum]|uniref:DUF262 domain-containing protein n=1 Tax=Spiroplasma endosymbiont of Aspidapion aeneum TaxID=3066276 RepID=UPI00313DB40E
MHKLKPINLLEKKYNYETKYQRDRAWNKTNSSTLIDSIINRFYIPPILVANNEVVDGKQRMIAIEDFINNIIPWIKIVNGVKEKIYYKNLDSSTMAIFNSSDIYVADLGKQEDDRVLELFMRINKGSIKLNKAEFKMATSLPENRVLIKNIAKNKNILFLTNNKKNDKRFKIKI